MSQTFNEKYSEPDSSTLSDATEAGGGPDTYCVQGM